MSFLLLLREMREISNHPQCPPHLLHMPPTHRIRDRGLSPHNFTSAQDDTKIRKGSESVGLRFRDPPETSTDLGKIFRDQRMR
jgi:hypothetical protein